MLRYVAGFVCLFLALSAATRAQGLDGGPWPTQDHDNRRSNQGTFSGPTSPGTPQLIYDAGSPIVSELVITSDGKLVLGGCSQQVIANQIVAIDATGKPVWPAPYTLIASNNESPMGFTVDASGRIYASAHDCPDIPGGVPVHLYSILPTGTSTPNWPIGFPAMYEPAAIGADGTIYQMDELTTLRALRPSDGSVVWSQNFCCFGQGAIALDSAGNLYASADGDEFGSSGLWSWSSAGALRWTALNGIGGAEFDRLFNTTAISPADVIYVSSLSGTVYAFNTSGSLLPGWPFVTGSPTASDSQRDSLAVGGSGTVYIKTVSAVFAINPDGTKKWSYSPGGDGTLSQLAVLDSNENVYFAFGNTVYSLTSSGTLRWTVPLDSPGRLYIGGAGTLYVISANQRVYAVKDAAPAGPPPSAGPPNPSQPFATTNEPINTANGNYYNQHFDFTIPSRGASLVFERTYNSESAYAGPLGANWTHTYNVFLTQDATGNVTITWGDGHTELYTLTAGAYSPQPGVFSTLLSNGGGSFLLTTKDQHQYSFSASGQLTSIQDRNGNTTSLAYGAGGILQSITAGGGQSLTFAYDSSNRIVQIKDPIGRSVSFAYSLANDLVQATDPAGGITKYAYDSAHRVTSIVLPNGNTLLQDTYDASGRVASQTNGRGFTTTLAYNTPAQGQTTITDPRGNKTIHTYDSIFRIAKITDPAGGTTSYAYNSNNNRTSVTNQDGNTTNFSYDSASNVTGVTDALGNTTSFTYDSKNRLLTATNPNGHTTAFTYDGNGNLTQIQDAIGHLTKFGYDAYGELISKTDARGDTTAYNYDAQGNLTKITDVLGDSTSLAYDGIGRLSSITDPDGHTATSTYDALNRLTGVADPLGDSTQFSYDPVGNLVAITDADGHSTNYAYDATNDLVSVTDALGHLTKYAYDSVDNRIAFTDANGNTTSYAYDALNRLSQITDPLSFATSYSFDPVGNVTSTTDPKGQTNKFTFDALNRLVSIAYADGKNVSYAYDPDGNRTTMTDSHGQTTYTYDTLDRLSSVKDPAGKTVTYAYDAVGNRASLGYPDGKVVNYSYDLANRLSAVTDWLGRITNYSYDPASNLTRTAYPNGTTAAFSYDAANRLTKIVNALKNLLPLTLGYALDPVGNRTSFSVDGIATQYGYDALNELTSAQLGPIKSTWTYDAVGNRTSETLPPFGQISSTYDADNRLLTAGKTTFAYDADGNEILKQPLLGPTTTYAYDDANRLISAVVGSRVNSFDYDGDGNRISQSVPAGTYSYLNDVATSLPVVLEESGPDGNIAYTYGLQLISESSSNFDYFYHYDGLGSVIGLSNDWGRPSAAYLYDPWGNALLTIPDRVGTRNKFRFTGEPLDLGSSLYFLRARYYDPALGRFISGDSFPGLVTRPLTLNRFSYGLNQPTNASDPSGLAPDQYQPGISRPVLATLGPSNANSTITFAPSHPAQPISPQQTLNPAQPPRRCYLQVDLPPGLSVFLDILGFTGIGEGPSGLDPFGPVGSYYIPTECVPAGQA